MKRAFVPTVRHRIEAADGDGTAGRRSALRLLLEEMLETVAVE